MFKNYHIKLVRNLAAAFIWTREEQINFQTLLIQYRLYGYSEDSGFSSQFLQGLSTAQKEIFSDFAHDLTFEEATDIFTSKQYTDPAMRGRQTFNPFKKFGFACLDDGVLRITGFGEYFLSAEYDLSEIFFRIFIKWQLPNPGSTGYKLEDGYNLKPIPQRNIIMIMQQN
ncbi:type IIs restriction endonuclease R.AlwI [uncultured Candidatus Thioglobus sp.]|nr:type IIs restriction endonuclease R.AlwI [uncultured Candidatus Thioglobus sp.]